jgi:hypothetical protein
MGKSKKSAKKTGLVALAAAALASPLSAATPVVAENPVSLSPHEAGRANTQSEKKNLLAQAPVDKPEIIVSDPNKADGGMQQSPAGEPAQGGPAQPSPEGESAPSQPADSVR